MGCECRRHRRGAGPFSGWEYWVGTSAVLGTTSARSVISILPTGASPITTSKNTIGLPIMPARQARVLCSGLGASLRRSLSIDGEKQNCTPPKLRRRSGLLPLPFHFHRQRICADISTGRSYLKTCTAHIRWGVIPLDVRRFCKVQVAVVLSQDAQSTLTGVDSSFVRARPRP